MPESGPKRSVSGRRKIALASKSAFSKIPPDGLQEVRIGLISGEPIRLEGLRTIFDQPATPGHPPLTPIVGTLAGLLANATVEFLVVDLNAPSGGLETLESVRRARPDMRLIVIGPESDEALVMDSIVGRGAGLSRFLCQPADGAPCH